MASLYDELVAKIARDPRLTTRSVPRADLGLLLYNAHADVAALWHAATAALARADAEGQPRPADLAAAVAALAPIFGPR